MKYDKHLKPENRIRRASTARDKLLRQGNIGKLRGGREERKEKELEVVVANRDKSVSKASEQLPQGKRESSSSSICR